MKSDNFSASWICTNLMSRGQENGETEIDLLYSNYKEAFLLKNPNGEPLSKSNLGKLLIFFFPSIKRVDYRGRNADKGKKKGYYIGLEFKEQSGPKFVSESAIRQICDKFNTLVNPHFVTDNFKLSMFSFVIANGNHIMKELIFEKNTWKLIVGGKCIPLDTLFISNEYDGTLSNLESILFCVSKLRICQGFLLQSKHKTLSTNIVVETIQSMSDDGKGTKVMKTKSCDKILTNFNTSGVCHSCQKRLNETLQANADDGNEIQLNDIDSSDLSSILAHVFPNASPEMQSFLEVQSTVLKAGGKTGRRWSKDVIKKCLSLWSHSPKAYQVLQDSNFFLLPSGRQLQRYKNIIPQTAGVNTQMLHWMYNSAKQQNITVGGMHGGLVHDEMKIQEGLVLNVKGRENKLIGWVDLEEEANTLAVLRQNDVKQSLASDVLQVAFLGYTGFRFPVAHYPCRGVTASELYIIIWNIVSQLQSWGFETDFILQDGGQQNREFMKLHFEDAIDQKFTGVNLANPSRQISHSQDYSHCIKKLRNGVLSSGIQSFHVRKLSRNGKFIVWQQWIDAHKWDTETNSRQIHHQLTPNHLNPKSQEKMRNHLAEEVLNADMLHLMQEYKKTLYNGSVLDLTIEFLEVTSALISIFRDKRPIYSLNDTRMKTLQDLLSWFCGWEEDVASGTGKKDEKQRRLFSYKCMDDIKCLILTFKEVVKVHTKEFPHEGVFPYRYNSDVIENNFCQVRGLFNGNTTNPTYSSYCNTMNIVILGQSSKSRGRKSNAGLQSADPFSFHVDIPTAKKVKKENRRI